MTFFVVKNIVENFTKTILMKIVAVASHRPFAIGYTEDIAPRFLDKRVGERLRETERKQCEWKKGFYFGASNHVAICYAVNNGERISGVKVAAPCLLRAGQDTLYSLAKDNFPGHHSRQFLRERVNCDYNGRLSRARGWIIRFKRGLERVQ